MTDEQAAEEYAEKMILNNYYWHQKEQDIAEDSFLAGCAYGRKQERNEFLKQIEGKE